MSGVEKRGGRLSRFLGWVVLGSLLLGMEAGRVPGAENGPVVKQILIVGNTSVRADDIRYRMRTREGRPLDRAVLDEDFKRIWDMGQFSDVQIQEEALEDGVRLRVVVKEKEVIRRILFRGNRQVSVKQLQSLVRSAVGQNYDPGVANRDVLAIQDWYRNEYYYFTTVSVRTEPFEDGVRLVYTIDERGRVVVKDILFQGNRSFSAKELLTHMATKPSTLFNRGKYERKVFEQDLERLRIFYQSQGFLDVQVKEKPFQITSQEAETKWRQQEMYVHIDIEEGEVYRVGKISFQIEPVEKGAEPLHSDTDLRPVIQTLPGDPYSPIQANEDARLVRDFYGASGRIFTKVMPQRVIAEKGTVVDLVFHVQEGKPILAEGIDIAGLVKTQEKVVRRELEIYPGEVFDARKMEESVRNLNRLDLFHRPVTWDVKEGSSPDQAKVVMDLEEKPTGQFSMGVGLSSNEGVVGSLNLRQRNFDHRDHPDNLRELLTGQAYVGAGEYFSLNLSSGTRMQDISVDFLNPWIFERPVRFGMGAFLRSREWSSYDTERTGAYVLLGRSIFGKNWDLSGRYKIERVNMTDFNEDVSADLRAEEGTNWISRGILRLAYDTRDDIFDPTKGWYIEGVQELAGGPFAGDKDFWRTHAEANYFRTFWRDSSAWKRPHVLAFRLEGAKANAYGDDEQVPVYERWYAGGIGSVRGFDYSSISPQSASGDAVGGESLTTASAEYFFPLFEEVIRGSLFFDTGGVWSDMNDWGGDWRSAWGIGLHFRTPLGPLPIRIYYSMPIQSEKGDDTARVQFTFGAVF
ncbi:MAG: outer membrane protein assembly factor BamA [Planctomycetota bacterium]